MYKRSDERGVVSILTVLFFVILLSVLTVAFLRIMSDEQEQVIGDDLTKGALASAQSGVEDAKRALLYCKTVATGADKASCDNALGIGGCPGIFWGGFLATKLGIPIAMDGVVQVGNSSSFNQRYTCLGVTRETDDVLGKTDGDGGLANMIELNTDNLDSFDEIKISWHRNGTSYDGASVAVPTSASIAGTNPQTTSWRGPSPTFTPYPAVLRVQLMEYDPAVTLDVLARKQLTYFLVPSQGGGNVNISGPIDNTVVPQVGSALRRESSCSTSSSLIYACSTSLMNLVGVAPGAPAGKRYFLRVSSMYRSTNYKIELKRAGVTVKFDDVQPIVDSTGAADNVYRRIISRVEYGAAKGYYPDNALQTGNELCKAFYVTSDNYGGASPSLTCQNGLATP